MKVKLVDNDSPRSDGIRGRPTDVTLLNIYEVIGENETQYVIINDRYKKARYTKTRFEVVDCSPIVDVVDEFNRLTAPLRMRIGALELELRNTCDSMAIPEDVEAPPLVTVY